jgi:hypothetical protein
MIVMPRLTASLIAIGVLLFLGLLVRYETAASTRGVFASLVEGADGRLSTSKFQWLLWTVVAIFAFVEVTAERLLRGLSVGDPASPEMPVNLLVAMGLSAATMIVAKGVTSAYARDGLVDKSGVAPVHRGGLLTDDDGAVDLSKAQMVSFTLIAIAFYLIRLLGQAGATPVMVDIDGTLMALMGLSQGGYLGKKMATRDPPPRTQAT